MVQKSSISALLLVQCGYSLTKEVDVSLPLFMQLTEQKEHMMPPIPRLWSTSPVLISVLQVWQLASLLCAWDREGKHHIKNNNRILMQRNDHEIIIRH